MKKKTALITGSAGFIGTNLVKRLLSLDRRVIGLDNFYSSSPDNVKLFKDNSDYSFIKADVRKLPKISEHLDEIYNLACPASPPIYQKDPIFTLETSILGIKNTLELAKKNKAKILHASTSEIYGDPDQHPQKETYWGNVNPIGPRSCYDEGKRVAETYCYEYFNLGVDVRVVRIFNTYGPFMDPKDGRVVSNFLNQVLRGENLTIYGDGKQTRSFCFIDDLIEGMLKFMKLKKRFLGPINLGNPDEFTILELAQKAINLAGDTGSGIEHKPLPKDDPKKRRPGISLAKSVLNWQPKINLDEGLEKTMDYFKSKLS